MTNKIICYFFLFVILTCKAYATSYLTLSIVKTNPTKKIYYWRGKNKKTHGDMNDALKFLKQLRGKELILNIVYEGNFSLNEEILFLKKIFNIGFNKILLTVIDSNTGKEINVLFDVKDFKIDKPIM